MDERLITELLRLRSRFYECEVQLGLPETISQGERYRQISCEYAKLLPIVSAFEAYLAAKEGLEEALVLIGGKDLELAMLARIERAELSEKITMQESILRELMTPKDPDEDKGVIVEIRAAAGGEEAALFASDLYRMYSMYASACCLRTELLSANQTELGGYKTLSFSIEGEGAFARFRYESGVHRVQRVPKTESQGRIQTSTVTVAVLPQAEEVEIELAPSDLIFESMKSSGAGGQHINKTESAVRLTHKPTGIVIECDGERSQFKNRDRAMKMLRAKLYEMSKSARDKEISQKRRSQVGTGDRSERIRTYNFPQSRVTDHRIGYVCHQLDSVLEGGMDEMVKLLRDAALSERNMEEL